MRREIRLEDLVGRRVVDAAGQLVGRIEDLGAERVGDTCVITELRVGPTSSFARIGSLVSSSGERQRMRIPWQLVDLSDPKTPRLTVTIEELRLGAA